MIISNREEKYYSPYRPDARHIHGVFLGLHAFVPVGLLADSHVAVSGNGAPQFAKEGFVRVLLPTRGQTEIVFTPVRPGTYPYFCDLPGHVMRGTIVVRENPGMVQ